MANYQGNRSFDPRHAPDLLGQEVDQQPHAGDAGALRHDQQIERHRRQPILRQDDFKATGGDTLIELRQAFAAAEAEIEGGVSPRVAPAADLRDLGALLQRAGFALPVTDVDRVVVRYDHAFALMQDLRRMGATNVLIERRRTPLRRATLGRMAQIYADRFSDPDGRIRATFEIVWLSGWSPHESQQQPLKPGSAKVSLEEAVKGSQPK
jgi:hypothetical protein